MRTAIPHGMKSPRSVHQELGPQEYRRPTPPCSFSKNAFRLGAQVLRPTLFTRDQNCSVDHNAWDALAREGIFRIWDSPQDLPETLRSPTSAETFTRPHSNLPEALATCHNLGKGSLDIPFCVSVIAQLIGIELLRQFGNAAHREDLLPQLTSGKKILAVCNSEPQAGTDIRGIRSHVTLGPDGTSGHLFLDKRGATNLSHAEVVLVSTWTREEIRDEIAVQPQLEVLVLDDPTLLLSRESCNESLSGFSTGMTGSLRIAGAPIEPRKHQLGAAGDGFKILKYCFNLERLMIGATMSGVLEGALAEAYAFAESKSRPELYSLSTELKPLPAGQTKPQPSFIENQYIQEKLIQIYASQAQLQALVNLASQPATLSGPHSSLEDQLERAAKTLAVLKMSIIDEAGKALQSFYELFGFVAYTDQHLAQKLIRDHMALRFLGGTREQQKLVLFNELRREHKAREARSRENT